MLSAINSALSGMTSGLNRLETSAHHTANLSTKGFTKDTILQNEGGPGEVVARIEKSTIPISQFPDPDGAFIEGSNVDLAEEATQQILAALEIKGNLASLKASETMGKNIIDRFA